MAEPNGLQRILGYSENGSTAQYDRSFMLRRLAQATIANARNISQRRLGRELGIHQQTLSNYFTSGHTPAADHPWGGGIEDDELRREYAEDLVEQAIERISAEDGTTMPPVQADAAEAFSTALTRELMYA